MTPLSDTRHSAQRLGPHPAPPPVLYLGGRRHPAYGVFGIVGLGLGILLAGVLTVTTDGSPVALALAIVAAFGTAYLFTVVVRAVAGRELLVFYHYLLLVPAVGAAVLALGGWPLLPHLEPLVLGLGLMQAVGRWGCLGAGCCHGRPAARWLHPLAVVYGRRHGERGFPRGLLGVPLVPVQVVESGWILACLAVASVVALRGEAGAGLVVYLLLVPAGRFGFEFLRGDPHRPHLWGLSEAQWTSLALTGGTAILALFGPLPTEHLGLTLLVTAPVVLALGALAVAVRTGPRPRSGAAAIAEKSQTPAATHSEPPVYFRQEAP